MNDRDMKKAMKALTDAQGKAAEENSKVEYYSKKLSIKLDEFQNELRNPHADEKSFDDTRAEMHSLLDLYLDSMSGGRTLADQLFKDLKSIVGDQN